MTLEVVWICDCGLPIDVTINCAQNAKESGIPWQTDPNRVCDGCAIENMYQESEEEIQENK